MRLLPKWMQSCWLALFAVLPWSFECSFGVWKLNLPSEPLIAVWGMGLAGFVWQNPGVARAAFSNNFLLQMSAAWAGWLAVGACFSTMPVVSWKYWVVEAGHWWVFAAGAAMFPDLWRRAVVVFAISMAGVVFYTLAHHAFYDFRADQALLAPMPFFPENTVYAAVLGMVLFLEQGGKEEGKKEKGSKAVRFLALIFIVGLVFSFCRAAWISVLVAGMVGFFLIFKEKKRLLVLAGGFLLVLGMAFGARMLDSMARDVSMLERFNRFACALRMAQEKPLTGFGPGTFQFQYIPYQRPEEMTRISAQLPVLERSPVTYGRGGGAHSEFFQALAENGWPGLAIWLALMLVVLGVGFKLFFREKTKARRWFALALALSLLTFFLHGIVNNMLHDGRVAALFWGMVAQLAVAANGGDGNRH